MSWQHVNLHGEFDFSDDALKDSLRFDVEALLSSSGSPQPARSFHLCTKLLTKAMIDLLDLHETVRIGGHVRDISAVWRSCHALVLPPAQRRTTLGFGRGHALRPAIAVNAGGMAELLTDNVTGFLAAAPTPQALAEALEQAMFRQRLARNNFEFAYHSRRRHNPTRTVVRHLTLAFALASLIIFRHSLKGLLGHLKKKQWLTR